MKKRLLMLGLAAMLALTPMGVEAKESEKEINYQSAILPLHDGEVKIIYSFLIKDGEVYWVANDRDILTSKLGEYLIAKQENYTRYVGVSAGLNIRTFPNVEYDNIYKALPYGTKVNVVGVSETGWAIVNIDGNKYFCWNEYLTKIKPEIKKTVTTTEKVSTKENEKVESSNDNATYSASYLKRMGVINWGGWRWTWYSQKVLSGGGLKIPGRHVDGNGYVCDENGYICLASGSLAKGTVVKTPFGKMGKVYDCGCAANTLDVYTNF